MMLGDNIEWVEPPPTPPAGDLRDGGMPADVLRALDGESARKVRRDGQHGEWLTIAPDGLGLAFALPAEMCEPEPKPQDSKLNYRELESDEFLEYNAEYNYTIMKVPPEHAYAMHRLCSLFNQSQQAIAKLTGNKCQMRYGYEVDPSLRMLTGTFPGIVRTTEFCRGKNA
jgi:hypothetical protein